MARGNRKSQALKVATEKESLAHYHKTRMDIWRDRNQIDTPSKFRDATRGLAYEVGAMHEVGPNGLKLIASGTDGNANSTGFHNKAWFNTVRFGGEVIDSHNHPDWGGSFSTADFNVVGIFAKGLKAFYAADDIWDYKLEGMTKDGWADKNGYSFEAHKVNFNQLSMLPLSKQREITDKADADFKAGFEKNLRSATLKIKAGTKAYDEIVQRSIDEVCSRMIARGEGPAPKQDKVEWWAHKMTTKAGRCEVFREVSHLESEAVAKSLGLTYTRTLRTGLSSPPAVTAAEKDKKEWLAYGKTTKRITPNGLSEPKEYANPY